MDTIGSPAPSASKLKRPSSDQSSSSSNPSLSNYTASTAATLFAQQVISERKAGLIEMVQFARSGSIFLTRARQAAKLKPLPSLGNRIIPPSKELTRLRLREAMEMDNDLINPHYFSKVQAGTFNRSWRKRVAEWFFSSVKQFNYSPETAFIAMRFFDRFFSKERVSAKHQSLVVHACFLIAGKVNEDRHPSTRSFAMLLKIPLHEIMVVEK